ncbi:MAG: hypothetical protein RJA99_4232 [Pseudomonadota bacterium]|jgi:hypothetical protein
MAEVSILSAAAPYYTVRVQFGEHAFEQTLVSINSGQALTAQLQEYGDAYEAQYGAMQDGAAGDGPDTRA